MKSRLEPILLPLAVAVLFVLGWHFAVKWTGSDIFPAPEMVVTGTVELARKGVLLKYVVASLFRVTTGYLLAVFIGIPLGLLMGWFGGARLAFNPAIQVLRPISPIAWIPIAILWFGVSDLAPIFLIFLASLFPITTAAMAAVQNIQLVYIRAARNFGITGLALFKKVVFPAALPQILTGLRLALGVAWLVVVAAEMIAVNSGLGYLIIDARNAGKRYDLVVAGMVLIGLIGLGLDYLVRRMETLDQVRWGLSRQ
ncbi:MAG TPA: ABC transporter permease [Thermoanaerobaculia bacterium]|nr:ABC transporter permease [Thermoanaerobaculia bacterium]